LAPCSSNPTVFSYFAAIANPLARIFYESLSRDRETGNPLAGLSGLSRRSFSEDGSAASAKKMGVPRAAQALAPRAGQNRPAVPRDWLRGVPE